MRCGFGRPTAEISAAPMRFSFWLGLFGGDGRSVGSQNFPAQKNCCIEFIARSRPAVPAMTAPTLFTGRSVNCRHTPEHRREIMESRVNSVRVLGEAVSQCNQPPVVWVQASSLAIYGDPGDRWCDEDSPHAEGFSEEVCKRWEGEFEKIEAAGMRKVVMRIGIVLDTANGALPVLGRLTRFFLGGRV